MRCHSVLISGASVNQPVRLLSEHTAINTALLRAVPGESLRVLEVGCGTGQFGAALKSLDPRRVVFGIESNPDLAAAAARCLDRVFVLDAQREDVAVEAVSLDAILYPDTLAHFPDPLGVLLRHRRLLRPGGVVLACVPNVQHHGLIADLLKGDWQYRSSGLLDKHHLRFFTYATALKLLLDAGFAPRIVDTISVPGSEAFLRALTPMLTHLGLHAGRTRNYLDAYQFIVRGDLLPDALYEETHEEPLTFAVCVSDEATLAANLLASPCLQQVHPHQVVRFAGCSSAAEGLNAALATARHEVVVCVHQDVYLPRGWVQRFWQSWHQAEKQYGRIGVAGVYGVTLREGKVVRAGHVVDRDCLLWEKPPLPATVDTLDELLLAVRKDSGLRFDPALGFHFYGADLCLEAQRRGLSSVVIDALCLHHSKGVELPEFHASGRTLAQKWASALPLATSCAVVDASWLQPTASLPGGPP
jgi:SAM-dependent methyltransferase